MSSDAVTTVSVEIAGSEISFETGKMAKQASGAVVVRQGDTMVLSTATVGNLRDVDFLPLTVDVEERMYAAGKIPGSFFKREGRAGEKGTLTARMIDRPIRPLFPKGWHFETQLVTMPLSVDHVHPYDILAMNGASAALMISAGPARRRPSARCASARSTATSSSTRARRTSLDNTDLDLVVAGTEEAILMVEAGANEVSEAEILDALDIAHVAIKKLCAAQRELAEKAGKAKLAIEAPQVDEGLLGADRATRHGAALDEATQVDDKLERQDATKAVEEAVLEQYSGDPEADDLRRVPPARAARVRPASRSTIIRERIAVKQEAPGRPRARARSARSRSRSASRRARTARRSSPAARRRRSRVAALGTLKEEMRLDTLGLETQEVLLAPLQLPAVLGGRGGLHARPQAP